MSDLLSIGLSGLNASQVALNTTGNNIANADTPGYSRQSTVQTSRAPQASGAYFIGTGTSVADVRRSYSAYLNQQLQTSTALDAEAQAYLTQTNSVDSLLSDSTTGLSTVMANLFGSLQTVAASPADIASRQLVLTQAGNVAQRFNAISSQLDQQNAAINSQLESLSTQVNALTASIAQYNKAIVTASAGGAAPNDLLDQRDQAITELSKLVGVSVVQDGAISNIYLGSGQPLVVGNNAATLSASSDPSNPGQDRLLLASNTASSTDVTGVVSGGEIGGLLRFRRDVLQPTQNELGRMAIVLADTFNSQLAQGLDLNGEFGAALFQDINDPSVINQRSLPNASNSGTGNLNVSIEDSSKLTTSDYQVTFTSATAYTITRLSDGTTASGDLTADPALEMDGFSISQQSVGTIAAGDTFTVLPTRTGAANLTEVMTDANSLALAAPLTASANTSNYGSGVIGSVTLDAPMLDSTTSAVETSIQTSLPVKLVFGDVSGGTQSYTLYDASGTSLSTGTIVPGQQNDLSFSVGTPSFTFSTRLSGSPGSGDSFTIAFNSSGYADNRNAQKLIDLQTTKTVAVGSGGGMSLTGAYGALTESVGAKASQADLDASATAAVLSQAQSSRNALSGVNLDEEAANLVKFQQYYTASSQIIKTAQTIFDTLINAL